MLWIAGIVGGVYVALLGGWMVFGMFAVWRWIVFGAALVFIATHVKTSDLLAVPFVLAIIGLYVLDATSERAHRILRKKL
jgi:hypothetical protein